MDELFLRFVRGLFIVMGVFGLGATIIILFGNQTIGLRMVNVFASMFVTVVGFGSGYILGRTAERKRNGNGGKEAE